MRGTASHDVTFDDVFVPDERVLADRPHGELDPPLQVIATIGFSVIAGVYLGDRRGRVRPRRRRRSPASSRRHRSPSGGSV